MENHKFNAFVVEEKDSRFTGTIQKRTLEDLPSGDLVVKVRYSSLNYKDALSASGNKGVTKTYPHTPGIDAVGSVFRSDHPDFTVGDRVIVTSYDLGMNTPGGFGEYIRVPSDWALKLPEGLSEKEAMIYGTAGLTAGISVFRLTELVKPEDGKIVVSGATGGVGSLCLAILSRLGYSVTAITGKEREKDYLTSLGADEILLRHDVEKMKKSPLLKPLYAGAVDTVGGVFLENIIKTLKPNGAVTCCGNVASPDLELTVYPFILRGISLIGIDSQNYPMEARVKVWQKLAEDWKPETLQNSCTEISLDQVASKLSQMLSGKLKGRTILNMGDHS